MKSSPCAKLLNSHEHVSLHCSDAYDGCVTRTNGKRESSIAEFPQTTNLETGEREIVGVLSFREGCGEGDNTKLRNKISLWILCPFG